MKQVKILINLLSIVQPALIAIAILILHPLLRTRLDTLRLIAAFSLVVMATILRRIILDFKQIKKENEL